MSLSSSLAAFLAKNLKALAINAIAVSLIIFLSVNFLILPLKNENNVLKQAKVGNESVLARQQLVIFQKNSLKPKIEKLNIAIPDDPQILKLGSTLQTITVKSGMLLKSLNFEDSGKNTNRNANLDNQTELLDSNDKLVNKNADPAKSGLTNKDNQNKNIATVVSKVVLVGSEEGFKKFLQAVENNLRLIDVSDMKIPEQGQDDGGNNTYTLELNAYYLPSTNF